MTAAGASGEGTARGVPMRLFVAVDVPGEVRERLERALAPQRDRVPGARWTAPEGWHATLTFLGSTPVEAVGEVRAAVRGAAAASAPFDTALTRAGAFPSARRARVLWVGLADPDGRMAALAGVLVGLLAGLAPAESRPFSPHLTVARLRAPADLGPSGFLGAAVSSEPFPVDRLVLYRSRLSPAGARYEALGEAGLGAGP